MRHPHVCVFGHVLLELAWVDGISVCENSFTNLPWTLKACLRWVLPGSPSPLIITAVRTVED